MRPHLTRIESPQTVQRLLVSTSVARTLDVGGLRCGSLLGLVFRSRVRFLPSLLTFALLPPPLALCCWRFRPALLGLIRFLSDGPSGYWVVWRGAVLESGLGARMGVHANGHHQAEEHLGLGGASREAVQLGGLYDALHCLLRPSRIAKPCLLQSGVGV
ncbi:hypothetical protein BHE74_00022827 [Ensete ventricosum]|nr:hypothetical protein BHE74_00022827 [Ensete ventricosum]